MVKIFALLKVFNKKKYASDFMKGKLYANKLSYFKKISDNSDINRKDELEAISASYQADKVNIELNNHALKDLVGQVTFQRPYMDNLNIFCMYAINSGDFINITEKNIDKVNKKIKLDNDCLLLGDYSVIVTNGKEFIKRIKKAIKKENYGLRAKLVDYYNPLTFNGSFSKEESIFKKRNIFKHQNEYRFLISTNTLDKALILNIGDIRDITMLIKTSKINDTLKLSVE